MLSQTTRTRERREGDLKHVALFLCLYVAVIVVATLGRQALSLWQSPRPDGLRITITRQQAVEFAESDPTPDQRDDVAYVLAQDPISERQVAALTDEELTRQYVIIGAYGRDIIDAHRGAEGTLKVLGFLILAPLCVRCGYRKRDAFFGVLLSIVGFYVASKVAWRATSPRRYWIEGCRPIPSGWRGSAEGLTLGLGVIFLPMAASWLVSTPSWWVRV